jgi:transposase
LLNRSHVQVNPVLKVQTKARLSLVDKQLAELNTEIARHIGTDKALERKREILCSIPGLGPITAALILTFLPEIGILDRKKVSSLAGLVPHRRESGQWKGKSFISGGRKPLRDAHYMPALVGHAVQPRPKGKIRRAPRGRQGRRCHAHAQADRNCKRSRQSQSQLDPKIRLTKTDTIVMHGACCFIALAAGIILTNNSYNKSMN